MLMHRLGKSRHLMGAAFLALALCACDEDGSSSAPFPAYQGQEQNPRTVAVGSSVAFVSQAGGHVDMLSLAGDSPQPQAKRVRLPSLPRTWSVRNEHEELLLLSDGDQRDGHEDPRPRLTALAADGSLRNYDVEGHFGRSAQSQDGHWVVLFSGEEDGWDRVVSNLNQVALVDLTAPPSEDNPRVHTLLGLGGSPRFAEVTAELDILGEKRRLAVFYSQTYISIFDLSHPERAEITVPLGEVSEGGSARPEQVVYDEQRAAIFVRTSNSPDVYMVGFSEDVDDVSQHDFVLAPPNPLPVGSIPRDIRVYEESDGTTRLLALASQSLAIVEPNSARLSSVRLTAAGDRMLPYRLVDDDESGPGRLLVYGAAVAASALSFVDLNDLEDRRSRNVSELPLPYAISAAAEPLVQGERVVLQHSRGNEWGQPSNVAVIDLALEAAFPLTLHPISKLDPSTGQLWVAGQDRVAVVDLPSLSIDEFPLDAYINTMLMPSGSPFVVFDHGSREGYITLVDRDEPSRAQALSLRGFFWESILAGDVK